MVICGALVYACCIQGSVAFSYEASDLLLGDHLFEKSDAVQWIDVSMPHK